jgi:protein-S-isoprenylcysteine O-methyltransferase Ste14
VNQYLAFGLAWVLWALSWFAAGFWSSPAKKRPPGSAEIVYRVLIAISIVLVVLPVRRSLFGLLWQTPPRVGWFLLLLALLGFGFAWWARLHLGRLWSSSVTIKSEHRIVDTGPYGLVRHPIYTGILFALYAAVLDHGTLWALIGAVLATASFVIKARLEERFLSEELGADAYGAYRARVPMLVPFWPAARG